MDPLGQHRHHQMSHAGLWKQPMVPATFGLKHFQTYRVGPTWKAEAGGSRLQCLLELQSEFKTSLGNTAGSCLQIKSRKIPD